MPGGATPTRRGAGVIASGANKTPIVGSDNGLIIGAVTDLDVAVKILEHLGLPTE